MLKNSITTLYDQLNFVNQDLLNNELINRILKENPSVYDDFIHFLKDSKHDYTLEQNTLFIIKLYKLSA